ncbi:1-deoxy-D-xylulose-5-phosphate synthase, partial [bacterium]|nr:1-deoxy-D-xylulose-5-phosphate synthase [bacterium]
MLENLSLPQDLKKLSKAKLEQLAIELREKIIEIGDVCGGHVASNLGVVELTLALHTVFDSPKDQIVWDVAHQCYSHKMLTGRQDKILTIRQFKGLSGFTKISESEHDVFGAGHSSTSISAALGLAHARDLQHKKN